MSTTSSSSSSAPPPPPHFVLLPFMSMGHVIPQIHIARLLSQRNLCVTIFSTPANTTFITSSLLGTSVTIKELPFPQEAVQGMPPSSTAEENTEEAHSFSMSDFARFTISTKSIQPNFELALESLSPAVNCIVYDFFLYWSQESADKFGIPALHFSGMSNVVEVLYYLAQTEKISYSVLSDDDPFSFPVFPNLKLTVNDFDKAAIEFNPEQTDHSSKDKPDDDDPLTYLHKQVTISKSKSKGRLVNSFYELESQFLDYWNTHCEPRAWAIGPLCLSSTDQKMNMPEMRPWIEWLDQKLACGKQVLYVSFGSQAIISPQQLRELAKGLVESNQTFLWVLKSSSMAENHISEFKDRVNGKGLILTEWVDQVQILQHGSIYGFLSHCGWNSVTEAISAGKPILAMPIMAEQHMNARILVDEFGIGLRIPTFDDNSIRSTDVEMMVREIMLGDAGNRARSKVKQFKEAAQVAIKEGGSSWCTLNNLIDAVKHTKL